MDFRWSKKSARKCSRFERHQDMRKAEMLTRRTFLIITVSISIGCDNASNTASRSDERSAKTVSAPIKSTTPDADLAVRHDKPRKTTADSSPRPSPAVEFKNHVQRMQRELPHVFPVIAAHTGPDGRSVRFDIATESEFDLAYDVQSTTSLVTPYLAYLKFPCSIKGEAYGRPLNAKASCHVTYGYQDDVWILKSVDVVGISGMVFSPKYDAQLAELDRKLVCVVAGQAITESGVYLALGLTHVDP